MAHGGFLRQHSDDPELASHIMHDYTKAELDEETRGMLHFATKLTREPTNMSEADVNGLRALGLSDEEILSVALITCQFNFMTRLADGLGVEVPPGRQEAHERWLSPAAAQQKWLMAPKG